MKAPEMASYFSNLLHDASCALPRATQLPFLALNGHPRMSAQWSLTGESGRGSGISKPTRLTHFAIAAAASKPDEHDRDDAAANDCLNHGQSCSQ
jgi:hypothetical protein